MWAQLHIDQVSDHRGLQMVLELAVLFSIQV
jgi:hypothetical protein